MERSQSRILMVLLPPQQCMLMEKGLTGRSKQWNLIFLICQRIAHLSSGGEGALSSLGAPTAVAVAVATPQAGNTPVLDF